MHSICFAGSCEKGSVLPQAARAPHRAPSPELPPAPRSQLLGFELWL